VINTVAAPAFVIIISVINKQSVAIFNHDIFSAKEFIDQLLSTAHIGIVLYIVPHVKGLGHKTGEWN
jgi:hypothetical protein